MIYAGIDEAGYGPMVGPMVVARTAFELAEMTIESAIDANWQLSTDCCLWHRWRTAVCRTAAEHRKTHRIAVNDSKKLHSKASGLYHLESGCLSLMHLVRERQSLKPIVHIGDWLTAIGSDPAALSPRLWWYGDQGEHARPWEALPSCEKLTPSQIDLSRNMLEASCDASGARLAECPNAPVVWEDGFNRMARATRSKAAVSFHYVTRHLAQLAQTFAGREMLVVVDRQGGRTRYRDKLAQAFPQWEMAVLIETPERSAYRMRSDHGTMMIMFTVEAERQHFPVALASMNAKYTRELMMQRFNAWFTARLPQIRPTQGYGSDGKRFVTEIRPELSRLGVDADDVIRCV